MTAGTPPDSLALARRIADLVRERRATDVVLLDVRELVDYTDWFLICSGQSGRQNQAISEHVVKTLKADHTYAISKSGLETGSWVCLDLGDVVVHIFDPETRSRYDLELLWGDAPRVEIAALPAATPLPGATVDAYEPPPAEDAEPEDAPVAKKGPAKRKRVVRKAAVEEADADNAPDSERPPEGEPEPESTPAPAPAVRGKRASSAEALGVVKRAGASKGRPAESAMPAPKPAGKGKLSPTPAASRAKASSLPARSKPKPSPGPAPAPKPTKPAPKASKPSKPASKPSPTPAKPSKPAPKSPKPKKR